MGAAGIPYKYSKDCSKEGRQRRQWKGPNEGERQNEEETYEHSRCNANASHRVLCGAMPTPPDSLLSVKEVLSLRIVKRMDNNIMDQRGE